MSTLTGGLRARPVASFFALTLLLSWALWVPAIVLAPPGLVTPAVVVGSFGPAVAGLLVTRALGADVRAWAVGMVRWRRPIRAYALALAGPPAVGAVVVGVLLAAGGSLTLERLPPLYLLPVMFVFVLLLGGGNEEPGWRGFALPRLQAATDPLVASLAIGAVWAVWHAPLYLLADGMYYGRSFGWFAVAVLAFGVLFTWLYNAVDGSVLLCMVAHASVNTFAGTMPALVEGAAVPANAALAATFTAAAVAVLAVAGRDLGLSSADGTRRPGDASLLSGGP